MTDFWNEEKEPMAYTLEYMREQYEALYGRLGGALDTTMALRWKSVALAYSGPRRKYHTLEHVYWVLRRINEMADDAHGRGARFHPIDWDCLRWAAWYHDYTLNGSPEDEQQSADECRWASNGLMHEAYDAHQLILATAHDRIPLDHQAARLCDADLSILGADPEHFDRYEEQVREEWAHVPDELFKTARAVILKRFVERPWIYMTDYGRTRWERRARQNLERSMAKLGGATK